MLQQELAQAKWPAICIMCDASPKGKLDVTGLQFLLTRVLKCETQLDAKIWLPLISVESQILAWTPQRLPELTPTTIPADEKLREASTVAEAIAVRFLDDEKSKAKVRNLPLDSALTSSPCIRVFLHALAAMQHSLRPKTLGRMRQKRLVSREHLRCLGNLLGQLQLDIHVPDCPLRPWIQTVRRDECMTTMRIAGIATLAGPSGIQSARTAIHAGLASRFLLMKDLHCMPRGSSC